MAVKKNICKYFFGVDIFLVSMQKYKYFFSSLIRTCMYLFMTNIFLKMLFQVTLQVTLYRSYFRENRYPCLGTYQETFFWGGGLEGCQRAFYRAVPPEIFSPKILLIFPFFCKFLHINCEHNLICLLLNFVLTFFFGGGVIPFPPDAPLSQPQSVEKQK